MPPPPPNLHIVNFTKQLRYIPSGNSKFGAVTIENPETSDQSILTFRLFVDGKESWSSVLLSPPKVSGKGRARKDALWG